MPIGGSATELNITGARLKVAAGVDVTGSISYTTDATGFGSVTAQIDNNNTLNITSGKNTGVAKIERNTAATITVINHTNVNNNTTIHLALKNTATSKGVFITLGTFSTDDTVKVNYTDNYLIGPGETGMVTLRKVNGVISLFVREMFTSKATNFDNTDNSPFYIKDGVNYKYPLYKFAGTGLTSEVIQGTTYYKPSTGITTQTRPPKGIPENVTPPSASSFNIGNNSLMTTVEYSVIGVSSNFDFGSITDNGGTTQTRFLLTDGESSGSFTESGASSGDSYKLYIEKTDTTLSDTISVTVQSNVTQYIAFHHGTFSASDYSSAYSTVLNATEAGHVYSNSPQGDYSWGTLASASYSALGNTTYTWTPTTTLTGTDILMVAGGGGGGGHIAGGGGAGGLLHHTNQALSGQKTIVVGGGGNGGSSSPTRIVAGEGKDTKFTGFSDAIGGGAASAYNPDSPGTVGGSGGGGGHNSAGGAGTSGQGYAGGNSTSHSHSGGGGGAGGAGQTNGQGGSGGAGLDKSSVFGTTYGESGWFAGGGGGGARPAGSDGPGGQGGGGDGSNTSDQDGDDGAKHTGGGGGGVGQGACISGDGGSGIVLIKFTGDKITDKKVVPKIRDISNVTTISSKTINYTFNTEGSGIDKITYKIGSGSEVTTASGVYTLAHTPADYGTTTLTYAYPVNSSSTKIGTNFGPYSVTTKLSSLSHITAPILAFFSMGTTVTDSVNNVSFTTDSGSFTYDTTKNAITNTGSARMKLDFTSVRTDRNTAISAFYEFYLPNGTQYEYAASLGGVHNGSSGNDADAIGWYGSNTPTTHYWGNGTQELPTTYNYLNYYGKWIKIGWVREANGNSFKTYIDGVYVSTHTPGDGSLTGAGVLSYFYLFRHAAGGNENMYTTNDAISFRNLEIYQASFTDEQILAAFGS